jgi:hypothetical protein
MILIKGKKWVQRQNYTLRKDVCGWAAETKIGIKVVLLFSKNSVLFACGNNCSELAKNVY